MHIPFTYVIGYGDKRNIGLTDAEERVFTISIGNYIGTSPHQDKLIPKRINKY